MKRRKESSKGIAWIMIVLAFSVLVSCSDDKDDFMFDGKSLKQTTWEGTELLTNGDQVIRTSSIEIQFFSEKNGKYVLKTPGFSTDVSDFNYVIEGKMMNIKDSLLSGMYMLLEMNKDKMVLEMLGSSKVTLTLKRKY